MSEAVDCFWSRLSPIAGASTRARPTSGLSLRRGPTHLGKRARCWATTSVPKRSTDQAGAVSRRLDPELATANQARYSLEARASASGDRPPALATDDMQFVCVAVDLMPACRARARMSVTQP